MSKLYVIGFGPGDAANMTQRCVECLKDSDIIVGYTGYTELLRPILPDKTYHDTGMTREIDRCRAAIELAAGGKTVSVVSSGDSGVYGMASLIYELAEGVPDVEVEVISGVTAALSGGAVLGAPIGHDFAVISLSDLLTPWETIEERLRAAANGDFCICLYNPGSHKRADYLGIACKILLETLPPERICGIAQNIGRDGQSGRILTLGELSTVKAKMNETIFIGNSQTRVISGRMVTPRGYNND